MVHGPSMVQGTEAPFIGVAPAGFGTSTVWAAEVDDRWAKCIDELIAPPSKLLSTSVFEIVSVEGYPGSYRSVVRHVRARRGPRFRVPAALGSNRMGAENGHASLRLAHPAPIDGL